MFANKPGSLLLPLSLITMLLGGCSVDSSLTGEDTRSPSPLDETAGDWSDDGTSVAVDDSTLTFEIVEIDTDGATQTVSSSVYDVDIDQEPGRLRLAYSESWPSDRRSTPNSVIIRFVAGYGDADAVPETIKAAIKLLVGHLYEHREAVTLGHLSRSLQYGLERLLWPYKMAEV